MEKTRHHRSSPVAVYPLPWWIALQVLAALLRFFTGAVVLRRPGRWDATYTRWAPPAPDPAARPGRDDDPVPRTRWARRPGWHRQIGRAGAIAATIGYLRDPTLTVVVLAVLAAVAIARMVARAHRAHLYGPWTSTWWPYVAGKIGAGDDAEPADWVSFRTRSIQWVPVSPLITLVRPASAPPDADWNVQPHEKGGPLTRAWPWLAARLRPLTCPVGEAPWVLRLQARTRASTRLWASLTAGLLGWFVTLAESSRVWRAVPRLVRHDLTGADAEFVIRYPATYPAHPSDVTEIQRVLRDRLPALVADPTAPADDVDEDQADKADDEDSIAALPAGSWTVRNEPKKLRFRLRRAVVLPSDLQLDPHEFEMHPLHEIPVGVQVTRSGRARVVIIPLKHKTPHVSIAASTGWGKTTIANVVVSHLLFHGAHAVILDPKEIGFIDAFRNASPHVEIWTTVQGWVTIIERVLHEMNRRYRLMNECAERVKALGLPKMHEFPELYFQPLALVEDEKGSLTTAIDELWKREGLGDGKPGKGVAPTFSYQQQILWRGRAACVHMVTMAQQNNSRVFLNTDMRDQYMFRILAGPQTAESWRMTFPGVRKRNIPRKKGRAIFGIGPEGIQELQLARISDTDSRAAAQHGIGVADADNLARAEMLAKATGRPLWEVSPLPFWLTPPAQTGAGVPGQQGQEDTPAAPAQSSDEGIVSLPGGKVLRLPWPPSTVAAAATGNVPDDDSDDEDEGPEGDVSALDAEVIEIGARIIDSETDDEPEEVYIIGEQAAADFLGITRDAFNQRRKRAKRGEGPEIRGERRIGRSPAWTALELSEWHNLFRSAS